MEFFIRNWYALRNLWVLYVHAAREHMEDTCALVGEEMKVVFRYTKRVRTTQNDATPLLEVGTHKDFKREILHKVVAHRYSCQHRFIPEADYCHAYDCCPICLDAGSSRGFLVRIENDRNVGVVSLEIV